MKIVVIGGVATGMSAAMRAKRIDPSADVSVYDAGLYVSFSNCGMPYYFGDVCEREDLISRPPEYFEAKGIRVHTGARVSAIDRREKTITVERIPGGFWGDDADATDAATSVVSYDKLVYAPGAAAITPPIPGSELGHPLRVIEDMDAIERALVEAEQRILEHATDTDEHQRSTHSAQQPKPVAAIIGAGPVGIEIAENLIHRGFAVHVISRPAHVLKPLAGDLAQRVEEELTAHGVQLYLGDAAAKIIEITDEQTPNR
ncbi:MAG: FAD-dependent oxidoreductase, partial [Arcanobacterium sp.]|nr:FAD-dependent oxidoreductase [Arcanobacterium sp.]